MCTAISIFHGLFDDLLDCESLTSETDPIADSKPPPSLAFVAARSDRRRRRWHPEDGKVTASSRSFVQSNEWRRIAKVQKHKREAPEKKNRKVRKLVDAHTRATEKIAKLLHKATVIASSEPTLAKPLQLVYLGPSFDLYQLIHELNALALDADAAKPSMPLASSHTTPATTVENRIVQTATGGAFETTVEAAWLLPFDVERITNTLLVDSIRLVTRKNMCSVQTLYEDHELKVRQAVTRAKVKCGLAITKHCQLATRREPLRNDGSQQLIIDVRGGFVRNSKLVVTLEGAVFIHVSTMRGHGCAALGPLSRICLTRRIRAQPLTEADRSRAEHMRWVHAVTIKSGTKAERQIDKITRMMENLLLTPSQSRA